MAKQESNKYCVREAAAIRLVPSALTLIAHYMTLEGLTGEVAVGLRIVVSMTGFEPTRVDRIGLQTLRFYCVATPQNSLLFSNHRLEFKLSLFGRYLLHWR